MTFQAVARRHRCPNCTGRIQPERRESGARRSVVPSVIVAAFVLALAALEGIVPRLAAWVAGMLP